jgi:peptide/nickel transport system permease protein
MALGTLLGLLAGYMRGPLEYAIDVVTNAALAVPPLVLLLALTSVFKPSAQSLIVALGFVAVPLFARVAKANTVLYAKREWVVAARASGAGPLRTVAREVVPSVLLPVLSFAIVTAAALIIAEGSLSYLGLGVRPPQPSWGAMIAAGQPNMQAFPHEVFVPAAAFFFTVVSLNLIGDWCRQRVAAGGAR